MLAGRDLLGIAQTGTGKTAAFALPMLQRLTDAPSPCRPATAHPRADPHARRASSRQIGESFIEAYGRTCGSATPSSSAASASARRCRPSRAASTSSSPRRAACST
jgi:hypothetical protein